VSIAHQATTSIRFYTSARQCPISGRQFSLSVITELINQSTEFQRTLFSINCCSYMSNLMDVWEQLLKLQPKIFGLLFCGHSIML